MKVVDVIVLVLCPGECFTYYPELQERKKGIMISVIDDDMCVTALPSYFQDITFISRRGPVTRSCTTLYSTWHRLQQTDARQPSMSYCNCQPARLFPQQICITTCLYEGMSVMRIADELMINEKAVYAHKYMIMRKFNSCSDYGLMLLLNKLTKNCI